MNLNSVQSSTHPFSHSNTLHCTNLVLRYIVQSAFYYQIANHFLCHLMSKNNKYEQHYHLLQSGDIHSNQYFYNTTHYNNHYNDLLHSRIFVNCNLYNFIQKLLLFRYEDWLLRSYWGWFKGCIRMVRFRTPRVLCLWGILRVLKIRPRCIHRHKNRLDRLIYGNRFAKSYKLCHYTKIYARTRRLFENGVVRSNRHFNYIHHWNNYFNDR